MSMISDSWLAHQKDLNYSAFECTFTVANVANMRHASCIDKKCLKSEAELSGQQLMPIMYSDRLMETRNLLCLR